VTKASSIRDGIGPSGVRCAALLIQSLATHDAGSAFKSENNPVRAPQWLSGTSLPRARIPGPLCLSGIDTLFVSTVIIV
jgi:hypothetical protein